MDIKKFVIQMVGIVCITALSILAICSFFYYLIPIDFPGTVGEWITALSTLAGGSLTLGGVWWTINEQNKQRKQDLAAQYKPIIVFEMSTPKPVNTDMISVSYKNLGRGEAVNVTITIIDNYLNYLTVDKHSRGANLLPCNESNSDYLYLNKDLFNSQKENINFTIELAYTDLFEVSLIRTRAILTIIHNDSNNEWHAYIHSNSIMAQRQ